jgi:hypothetical protein
MENAKVSGVELEYEVAASVDRLARTPGGAPVMIRKVGRALCTLAIPLLALGATVGVAQAATPTQAPTATQEANLSLGVRLVCTTNTDGVKTCKTVLDPGKKAV